MVLAIPFVDGWILTALSSGIPARGWNPVIATILLFGLPSVVLGSVSPVAVRLKARLIENLGRTAGRLFAISTAGSIAGTFLTPAWLIPELGTDQVLAAGRDRPGPGWPPRWRWSSARGCVCARAYRRRSKRRRGRLAALDKGGTVAAAASELVACAPWAQPVDDRSGGIEESQTGYKIVETADSQYHRHRCRRRRHESLPPLRQLLPERTFLNDPYRTRFIYSDYLQLPFAYRAQTRRMLYIVFGGGSAPKRTWRDSPRCANRGRRADLKVVDIAYEHFELPVTPGWSSKSRTAVATCPNARVPGMIVVDEFYADAIQFHLATREFFEPARSRLTPAGFRGHEHHRGRERAGLTPSSARCFRTYRGLPDRRDSPRGRSGQRHRVGSQHHRRGR